MKLTLKLLQYLINRHFLDQSLCAKSFPDQVLEQVWSLCVPEVGLALQWIPGQDEVHFVDSEVVAIGLDRD